MCLLGSAPNSSRGLSSALDHSPKARTRAWRSAPLGVAARSRPFGACEGKPSRLVVFFRRNGDLATANFPHCYEPSKLSSVCEKGGRGGGDLDPWYIHPPLWPLMTKMFLL